ncbi:MAG: Coenzyme F420 hydrogenase/dehydrogenase, beta subunit C-terminal domain [Anaerolineae bacterium]|jgi:formate dehydrogenase subunit beta
MRTLIPVEDNDTLAAVQGFLRRVLKANIVDSLLVPMKTPQGAVTPALVSSPELLDRADPLAPVMGLNAARLAGRVSVREPRQRIGVVLRPCELRALVELVKLQQASLDDLVTIGIDCLGTYDVSVYITMTGNGSEAAEAGSAVDMKAYLATARTGELQALDGFAFRAGCQMCEKPYAAGADITLELFGADLNSAIPVSLPDDVAEALELSAEDVEERRADVIESVVAARSEVRDERFAEIRERLDEEGIEGVFAACIRCHNCMTVCPICYCKTCLFRSQVFDHEPIQYANWAVRKGAYRMPADTMLFHLTRLNHMVLSCVGCGMCTSDCPADLPVGDVFRAVGHETQAVFDYEPGGDVEEPLPLITFQEDEWMDVGEE